MAAIVEVIVGMVFLYILLSILVTEVNSLIARTTRLRARNLRGTLNDAIDDPVLQAKIYTHPLIQLVKAQAVLPAQRITREEAAKIAKGPIGTVDWIEASAFVDVMLSAMKAESDQRLYGALITIVDGMPAGPERRGLRAMVNRVIATGEGRDELRNALRYVQQRQYRLALADVLNQIDDEVSQLGMQPSDASSILASLRDSGGPAYRASMASVIASAASVDDARSSLETWFDNTMKSASANYAARMKLLSIGVALIIAAAVNIDTLHIARTLWEDPVRRAQISSEVNYSLQSGQLGGDVTDLTGDQGFSASAADGESGAEDVIGTGAELANRLQDLQDLRLPIGWTYEDQSAAEADHWARGNPNNLWNYWPENNPDGWAGLLLGKLLGIAATVISAAQGAPFWFGIVNRIWRAESPLAAGAGV